MKKITIKQGEKELFKIEVENDNVSDEVFDEIEKFNEFDIDSYVIKFEDSVKLKHAQNISSIKAEWIKEITVILK